MRKITISVAALLAINAIQAQAVTKTWDFSGVTEKKSSPITDYEIDGLFVTLESSNSNHINTGELRFNKDGDYAKFTAEGNGTVTVKFKANGDVSESKPRWIAVGTDKKSDGNSNLSTELAKATCLGGEMGVKGELKTLTVDVTAGSTIYIYNAGGCTVTNITYEYTLPPAVSNAYEEKTLTIKKDKESVSTDLILQAGTYKFEGPEDKRLTVKQGDVEEADNGNVLIAANNTKVNVTLAGSKVSKDTDVKFKYTLMESSLASVRSVYTQKVAVMINKANVYTNDTRLQECAVQASSLMAEANEMGITLYDEYRTTGKIATLDKKIADLSAKIDNAKAAYDGYVYAQGKYGNKYENGWVVDESNTTSLLAKKKELVGAYENVKDEAARAALKTVYDNALKALDDFKAAIDAEYAEGKQTDYAAYTSSIDTRVGSVKTDKVEASGVMGTLDEAKNAIVNGSGNATYYAQVNIAVNTAKEEYTKEANRLYVLLVSNPKDADTYRDMYVTALGELNTYLRVINEVKAENDALYQEEKCTAETWEAFEKRLKEADNTDSVDEKYNTLAGHLRANYEAACKDIEDDLTGYLESQVEDVIGKKDGEAYPRKEVSDFYAQQISAIKTSIASIKNKVDDVNKRHTIGNGTVAPYYADYVTDTTAVRKTISDLNAKVVASVSEFDYWESSKKVVEELQDKFDKKKDAIGKAVSGAYKQATKFSVEYERTIQERINALLAAANASFAVAVEVKDGETPPAEDFFNKIAKNQEDKDGKVTLYGSAAIAENIAGYAEAAKAAMTKYEKIVKALASYDSALNGVGKEGDKDYEKGLKDVVTETGVTIDGTFEGKTYGAYIAEVEEKIKGLQKKLNDAVALNDTLHVNAMAALDTLKAIAYPTKFDDLVAEINSLKDSYPTNAEAWNKKQLTQAKTSMLKEATRRVGALDTKNVVKNEEYKDVYWTEVKNPSDTVDVFLEKTYGKRAVEKEGLNQLLEKCDTAVAAIQKMITDAEGSKDDAAAIAILSTVVDSLAKAEAQYNSLRTLAEEVKIAYSAEKAARKELLVAKDGLIEKLSKVTFKKDGVNDMFATEYKNQSDSIATLTDDIEAKFDAETVVANKQTLVDAKGKIATAINNLNDLVAKEQVNKKADDAYGNAAKEINIKKAFDDAKAAIKQAVADRKAVQGSGAYNYYMNTVLAGYANDSTTIATNREAAYAAVREVYEKDNETVLSGAIKGKKYTDPDNNMVAKGAGLESQLRTLKTNVGKVAQALIDCEAAYRTQTTKTTALDSLRAEVFNIITSAETSGYHQVALEKLADIDKEIVAYNDSVAAAYTKGTNYTGKADIEAMAEKVNTELNTLKNGWNDEYSKAVAADNQERKHKFDEAYTLLTKTYAQDVDLIARLSKLSYADKLGGALESVVGKNGIYSYADKIRELKASAEAAYSVAIAPTLFDAAKKFQALAKQYTEEIDSLTTGYTTQVNAAADTIYIKELNAVNAKLDSAKVNVQTVLGAVFVTNDFLTTQFQDVQTIIDKAQGYTEKPDFAEYLDNTILPSFATVDSKIAADKLAAAKTVYTNVLTEYRTLANSEATLIAGYHDEKGTLGAFLLDGSDGSEGYKSFIERTLDKAEELWAKIDDADKFAKFNEVAVGETEPVSSALGAFGTPDVHDGYVKDTEGQPAEWAKKHTKKFWEAYDADQKYHANDIAYASMQEKIADVQAELDKANEFVASLIIRNNANILDRLSNAQGAINDLKGDAERYHNSEAKDSLDVFLADCDDEIATIKLIIESKASDESTGENYGALIVEKTALEVQIGFLQHDYNQAAAVNIDNEEFDTEHYKTLIAGYRKKNADILRDFADGKLDENNAPIYKDGEPVYATAEETRQAFIALETEVGKMKSELTALYNEAAAAEAQAAVQAKIDELTATYDEFVAQLADCHAPVKKENQPAVDAFKANIDALQAVLNAEAADNTVLLYQDENVKTASAIANSVENLNLSKKIADMEELYDVNDAKYLELRGQLNTLTERLESVHNAIKEYEHKAKCTHGYHDINGDDENSDDEKFSTVYEYRYAQASYYIAKDMEWLNGEYEKENSFLTPEATLSPNSQAFIDSYISDTEQMCAYFNADKTIDALQTALAAANDDIEDGGYTDADRKNLEATYAELNSKVVSLGNYNKGAYNNGANSGVVSSDIEGNPIENGKTVVYMEEYPAIMEAAKALKADVATLAEDAVNKSWEKGDVDHNGKITVADYDAVRQMVLELIEYTETDAMFYAADVNEDGLVNIGDVTQIGSKIMENKPFQSVAGASSVAMAKGMAAGMPTYGNLALTADGSGLAQTIKVAVDSRLGFVGGQFDVVLPKGVKLVSVASSSHDALMGEVDGAYRVLVSNLENTEIVNGQAFVELNVEVTSDYDGGGIEVRNVKFADADGTVFNLAKSSISTPTSLTNLTTTEKIQSKVYTVGGMLMNKVKKGINIIVNSDGTTKKQVIE